MFSGKWRTQPASEIQFDQLPEDNLRKRKPDIIRAKESLAWEPVVELNYGLKDIILFLER
jgi:nucleoside-diphosphate-sugar epimerase